MSNITSKHATINEAPRLTFGIYTLSLVGVDSGVIVGSKPDDPARIEEALTRLQAPERPFIVRAYTHYTGSEAHLDPTLLEVEPFLHAGRKLDLVLCFRISDVPGWLDYIREMVQRYGPILEALQITEEPNLTTFPPVDGCISQVREALIQGAIAAKAEARRLGYTFQVGFNAALSFRPQDNFWSAIGTLGGQPFIDALDYVGMDFFPDVFRPIAPEKLAEAISGVLTVFRTTNLEAAGIPSTIPMHIAENG